MHGATALSYVYLLLSGLAFWTPAFLLDRHRARRRLPHAAAPPVGRAGICRVCPVDVRDVANRHAHDRRRSCVAPRHARSTSATTMCRVPPAGRFNYGQKSMFWLMVGGALALLLSGRDLWWPHVFAAAEWQRPASGGDPHARRRRPRHDWRLHRAPVHGACRRAGRPRRHPARRGERRLGPRHHPLWADEVATRAAAASPDTWRRSLTTAGARASRAPASSPRPRLPPPICSLFRRPGRRHTPLRGRAGSRP